MPDLADILAGRGSALLGAGGFSIVVADPECPRTAIKIGPSLSDAWPAWAAFALEHPGPHVPVVHSLRWIWSRSGAPLFYVAEVERLEPTDAARAWLADCPEGKRMPCALASYLDTREPAIAALLRAARRAFPAGTFDMGHANWMQRPDGTLVLQDPLSWRARVGPVTHIEI